MKLQYALTGFDGIGIIGYIYSSGIAVMPYSNDDIENLVSHIARMLQYTEDIDLEDLLKGSRWKEVNFQDKCEGGNSLGDLLLKHATENNNPRIKDLFLRNGFKLSQQEQIAAAINEEEEEKNTPDVEENRADSDEVDFSNFIDTQFAMPYNKIKEIVTNNPNITVEEFGRKLKEKKINTNKISKGHCTLLGHIVNSNGPNITDNTNDRAIFLQIIKLLTDLKTQANTGTKIIRTGLSEAITTKQADVVRILLDSGKFNEEEKFNALLCAVTQKYVQGVKLLLGHVNDENMQKALKVAMDKEQTTQVEEITQVLLNFITPETSNAEENIVPAPPIVTEANANQPVSSSVNGQSNHNNKNKTPVIPETKQTATPNNDNKANGFVDAQFSRPNEQETKYKENFYTSLTKDVVGVVVTGLLITAAVMVPSVAGAVVCGIVAALVAIVTGWHIKSSTLPSYREMEENKVEHVSPKTAQTL
ncbi:MULTISPECIES: ankyrin repeat domain-containing protein [unclassified Wolbachia]|uniref:ankyrin repeat domain-containing protein n=1 Tax=unclassified Wolbachia TaxID=2640676 RepID=UPI0030CA189A